jgi:hypothetical protein
LDKSASKKDIGGKSLNRTATAKVIENSDSKSASGKTLSKVKTTKNVNESQVSIKTSSTTMKGDPSKNEKKPITKSGTKGDLLKKDDKKDQKPEVKGTPKKDSTLSTQQVTAPPLATPSHPVNVSSIIDVEQVLSHTKEDPLMVSTYNEKLAEPTPSKQQEVIKIDMVEVLDDRWTGFAK